MAWYTVTNYGLLEQKIEHAGYQRYIVNRNPRRFDEHGDELEQDEVDEEADAAAAEENPYSGIKLECQSNPIYIGGTSVTERYLVLQLYLRH